MNLIDWYCFQEFQEILDYYAENDLKEASDTGSYTFHEGFFDPFVIEHFKITGDKAFLKKVGRYIEYLASSENYNLNNLASIGIIESFINEGFFEIAPYLLSTSKASLKDSATRVNFDLDKWIKA